MRGEVGHGHGVHGAAGGGAVEGGLGGHDDGGVFELDAVAVGVKVVVVKVAVGAARGGGHGVDEGLVETRGTAAAAV